MDRHDDIAPPLAQCLSQGDVNELGRPVGRRSEVAGVHGRRRAQVVVGDLLGACEVLGDEEGRQIQIHAGPSAILGGSRSGRPRGLGWGLGQVAPVQEEADRLALGQRQTGTAPRRAQARRGRAQTQRGRVALVQPLVDGDPPQARPPAQGLLDDANHLRVDRAGTAGGGDERRLGAHGRLDGNDPPRQGIWPGGGEVLPQAHQDRQGDLRRDPGELGDHALAGGVIGAQPQQLVESAGEDPGAGGQQAKGSRNVAARQSLLQAGGETRFGAPGGDLVQQRGGSREAACVVAGTQVTGQALPPLAAPTHLLGAVPDVLGLPDGVEQTQQPTPLGAGEGGEPARLGQGDVAARHGDRQAQHIGDGAVGGGEVQAGEDDGEDREVLLDRHVRRRLGAEAAQGRQIRAVLGAEGGRLGGEVGHDPLQVLRRGQAQLGEGAVVSRQGLAGAGPVVRQDPDPDDVAQVVQSGIDQQRGLGGGAHLDGEVGVEGPVVGGRGAGGEAGDGIDQCPGLLGAGEGLPGGVGEPVAQGAQRAQGRVDTRVAAPLRRGLRTLR